MTSEERVAKLENDLARTRSSVKALGIAIVILVVMSAVWGIVADAGGERADGGRIAVPLNEVRAKKFVLVDDKGTTRAVLGALKDGSALALQDENGNIRAALSAFKDEPGLMLVGENGKIRAMLDGYKDGSGLRLRDENGNIRAALGASKDETALVLCDEKGDTRAMLGRAVTKTPDGKTTTYPESSLLLFGPDKKVLWRAP